MLRAENITPSILTWARETAGLSIEEAAGRIGLSSSTRNTATEKLEAFECGDVKPTRKQLLKIAATYRRPLTAFYLLEPPPRAERGEDFRTVAGKTSIKEDALLDALLRDIRARQDMVKSIMEDDEDIRPLTFVGSISVTQPINQAVEKVRRTLGFKEESDFEHQFQSSNQLFVELRRKVEKIGVFTLLAGNLGSHHTNISEKVFRGFAIADEIAPFIVINDQDAITARSFTLIHELAHVFLGLTGVSDAPSVIMRNTTAERVERFCNDVAGEFLLPAERIRKIGIQVNYEAAAETVSNIAARGNISEPMVAYRLWRTKKINNSILNELLEEYALRWQRTKSERREHARQEGRSGPSYYTVRMHRLGNSLISLVNRTLRANELTHTKAAKILGVKPSRVEPLLERFETTSWLSQ